MSTPNYVAFLRAINVGGRVVRMEALRKSFVRLGLQDVETFIASGNVLFTTRMSDTAKLERNIEGQLASDLGYDVATFVRTTDEVRAIARYQPFPPPPPGASPMLYVGFVPSPFSAAARASLQKLATDIDAFHVNKREWYWLCQKSQGQSTVSNAAVERALKVRSTVRGMNTIVRLAARLDQGGR